MVSNEDIENFIEKIPPLPETLRNSLQAIKDSDLAGAANFAKEDKALVAHLTNILNKPIFGFKKEIKDVSQMFSILGINQAKQILNSYLVSLITPKDWAVFKINNRNFNDLQADIIFNWNKILEELKCGNKEIFAIAALVPSAIIVCEELFKTHKADVELIRDVKNLDYSTILYRLSGKNIFDVAVMIAKKWEMSSETLEIIELSSGTNLTVESKNLVYAKYLHLLFFYELSKPKMIEGGLNDFIEFNVEFIGDIYESFQTIMKVENETDNQE